MDEPAEIYRRAEEAAKQAVAERLGLTTVAPPKNFVAAPPPEPPPPVNPQPGDRINGTVVESRTVNPDLAAKPQAPPADPMAAAFRTGAGSPPQPPEETPITPPSPAPHDNGGGPAMPPMQPAHVIPGGMRPDKMKTQVHLGKPVPGAVRQAYGGAAAMDMSATGQEAENAKALYGHVRDLQEAQLAANEDARLKRSQIDFERDQAVSKRLERVDALNKQAQGAPDDLWSDKAALAMVLGALSTFMGGASLAAGNVAGFAAAAGLGKALNSAVDMDLKSKLEDRRSAGQAADREMNLLKLHEDELGSREKAIDATRLAYFDNLMQQLEVYKAEHRIADADPRLLQAQAQILKSRADAERGFSLQEANDVKQELDQKYAPPQVIGGGAAAKNIPHKVVLEDGTTYALDTEQLQGKALAKLQVMQEQRRIKTEMLQIRQKLQGLAPVGEDRESYELGVAKLTDLHQKERTLRSRAEEQGVLTKADVERDEKMGADPTRGYGFAASGLHSLPSPTGIVNRRIDEDRRVADAVLRTDIDRIGKEEKALMRTMAAEIVARKHNMNPTTGEITPTASYLGKNVAPAEVLPPAGAKPMDPRVRDFPTAASKSVEKSTPVDPNMTYQEWARAAEAAKKRKKK